MDHNLHIKTLSETHPQDKEKARKHNARSTRTSCGVEGIVKHDLPPIKSSENQVTFDHFIIH